MILTGDIEIHKSDGVTRQASAVKITADSCLSLWDSIPDEDCKFAYIGESSRIHLVDEITQEVIEPDVVVKESKWERVERDGHSWKNTTPSALRERAKRRDDVDEDEIEF